MKRMIVVATVALLAAPAYAAECKPAEKYKVSRISYKARSLDQSLRHIVRGTPYRVEVEGGTKSSVKARRLSGALSLTLNQLAAQTGMAWQQEGCLLRFTAKQAKPVILAPAPVATIAPAPVVQAVVPVVAQPTAPAPVPTTWFLQSDMPIHKQFADWAHIAGWKFEWRLEKSWLVPAATKFNGTFDQALSEAVISLHAQGKPVRLIIWEGNRFAEIVDVDAK